MIKKAERVPIEIGDEQAVQAIKQHVSRSTHILSHLVVVDERRGEPPLQLTLLVHVHHASVPVGHVDSLASRAQPERPEVQAQPMHQLAYLGLEFNIHRQVELIRPEVLDMSLDVLAEQGNLARVLLCLEVEGDHAAIFLIDHLDLAQLIVDRNTAWSL